jgi:Cu-Zn family superoxide dismutase
MAFSRNVGPWLFVLVLTACGSAAAPLVSDGTEATADTGQSRSVESPDGDVSELEQETAETPATSDPTSPEPTAGDDGTTSTTDDATTTTVATAEDGEPDGSTTSTTTVSTATESTTSAPTTTANQTTSTTTTTTTAAPTTTLQWPDRIDLPAEVSSTEGIATDEGTGRIFVGELNNGNVWVGTPTGPWTLFNSGQAAGRATAFGMAVDASRGRLYVVSGVDGRVDVLNLSSGALQTSIAVPVAAGSLINDVTVAPDGTAYVTDTGAPRLYRIAPGGSTAELWVDYAGQIDTNRSQHGNGVVANGTHVLVAYMERGELLRFDRSSGAVNLVAISGATTAGRDGLVLCGSRLHGVEISSITGTEGVWITDLSADWSSGTSLGRVGGGELSGASTAAALDGHLVVVNAQFGVSPKASPYDLTLLAASC